MDWRRLLLIFWLRAVQLGDRARLAWLRLLIPGLEIAPGASPSLATASFVLGPGARLRIGPGVVADRIRGRLRFSLEAGAEVEIGAGTWLRTEVGAVHIVAFAGARLTIGPECLLNGCHLSAKQELVLGRATMVGPGTRVFDADQHPLDDEHPERRAPVRIGDHVWIAGDCTVLRGVTIGDHCVVGTRSLVAADLPDHTLAYGQPARPRGQVGDRTHSR